MQKTIYAQELSDLGWHNVDVDKTIVSYCAVCGCQRPHVCNGKKIDNGQLLLRFDCNHCRDRLNGIQF